jgi:phosphonate transport system permease protein
MTGVPNNLSTPMRDPAWHERVVSTWVLLFIILGCLVVTEFKPWTLFDATSLRATKQFLTSFYSPKLDAEFLAQILMATWQTIAVATAGVTLALLFAVPLALIATRTLSISRIGSGHIALLPTIMRNTIRGLLIVLRSVPELVWGLLFVRAIGLGDTAGVLAIALTYTGMMGKVFLEIMESQDARSADALLINGASRGQAFLYATLPGCLPEMVSYTVFRWECAIRSSVILGFVGAGGLGQQMDLSMKMLAGNEVVTMLAAFILLVWIADVVSKKLRAWLG